jgi:mannose-1-phosphate guanylyltransferase
MPTLPLRHALVLAAGLGVRLRPLTLVRAKPAVPVAGEPLVRRIVRWLAANEVDHVVLNLHHLPATLTAVVGDGSDLGALVRYSWEQPQVLGSAGGPRQALPILGADAFLIVNGDTLSDVDLGALNDAHRSSGALVTLALVPNRNPEQYGGVRLGADSSVTGFVPRGQAAMGSFHFVGVQAVQADAFRSLPAGQPMNSIGGLYDDLIAARPGSVRGVAQEAAFWDVGTVADYWRTSFSLMSPSLPEHGWRDRNVHVHETARIARSILWNDIEIGAGSVLDECIVTDGVQVPAGATYRRSILVRANGTISMTPFDPPEIQA